MSKRKSNILMVLVVALALMSGGCRTSHRGSAVHKEHTVNVSHLKGIERRVVEEALEWMGTPYKYGGSEKGRGTDCSGMVVSVYDKKAGIKLPRNSEKQSEFCKKIKQKDVRPGDLVFFATGKNARKVSHVGIMIDDTRFIHASTKKGVIMSEMTTPYYMRTFIKYGRVPGFGK